MWTAMWTAMRTASSAARRSASVLAACALVACHHAASRGSGPASTSGTLGETGLFGPRIVKVDGARARLTYRLGRPAYVVLLSVDPGRSIAPIATTALPVLAGVQNASVTIPEFDQTMHTVSVAGRRIPASERVAFDGCVQRTTRPTATRRVRRAVRTDSAGRPVDGGPLYEDVDVPGVDVEQAERLCADRLAARAPTHPRPAGYLVLLASTAPLTWEELDARLQKFIVTADDARGTIQAVAEGLYAGHQTQWAGAYVHW
jgi:hypothetical protein